MNNATEPANDMASHAAAAGGELSTWACVIGVVAIGFALMCFVMFCWDTISRIKAQEAAARAAQAAADAAATTSAAKDGLAPALDLGVLVGAAKALVEALKNAGPGLVAMIGAILFLVLAGQATQVWQIVGTFPKNTRATDDAGGNVQDNAQDNAIEPSDNQSDNMTNATG